jgi:hypothetical protein
VLMLLLLLLLPSGGCIGERVHKWPELGIAGIWRAERGISLTRGVLRFGIIAYRVLVGTYLVPCRSRIRVLGHAVMPTFTLVVGNDRILDECGKRASVAGRGERGICV